MRGTFLMFGAIGFQAAVGGSLMRPTKFDRIAIRCCHCRKDNNRGPRKAAISESQPLIKSLGLWCLLINSCFLGASLSIIFLFLPEFNIYMGSTHGEAAFIMSVVGIAGILSRIFLGFIGTILDPALVLFGLFGTIGTMTFFIGQMKNLAVKIAYAAVLGLYTGGTWSLQHTLVVEIGGLHRLSTVYGVTMFCAGFGFMSGPLFTDSLRYYFKGKYYTFAVAATFFMICSATAILIRLLHKPKHITISDRKLSTLENLENLTIENTESAKMLTDIV